MKPPIADAPGPFTVSTGGTLVEHRSITVATMCTPPKPERNASHALSNFFHTMVLCPSFLPLMLPFVPPSTYAGPFATPPHHPLLQSSVMRNWRPSSSFPTYSLLLPRPRHHILCHLRGCLLLPHNNVPIPIFLSRLNNCLHHFQGWTSRPAHVLPLHGPISLRMTPPTFFPPQSVRSQCAALHASTPPLLTSSTLTTPLMPSSMLPWAKP